MTANLCVRCGRPLADGALVCLDDAESLSAALVAAAGHAEDAEAVIARQVRYGPGSRAGFDETPPPDLRTSEGLDAFARTVGGWGRIVTEETGRRPRWKPLTGPLCPPTGSRCTHASCEGIRRRATPSPLAAETAWLGRQTGWLRRHPAASEAFRELHDACADLARLVDRPPDKNLVGMCDCGRVLYAVRDKATVTCPVLTCGLRWDVEQSRDILRKALDDKLVTAEEAARLAGYLDGDRTQEQVRKLVNKWASRGELAVHPLADEAGYRFGDVVIRLARAPRRHSRVELLDAG